MDDGSRRYTPLPMPSLDLDVDDVIDVEDAEDRMENLTDEPVEKEHQYGVLEDGSVVYQTPFKHKREQWLQRNARNYEDPQRCRVAPDGTWIQRHSFSD